MKALDALANMCHEDEIEGLRIAPYLIGGAFFWPKGQPATPKTQKAKVAHSGATAGKLST